MFDRFSEHSRTILTQVSKKVAYSLKSREVKPEHVLLTIDEDSKSVGARLIRQVVPEGVIRKAVEELSKNNVNGDFTESEVRFSTAVEKLLDVAMAEADSMGEHMIGTEHLILGMLKEPTGNAKDILETLGFSYESFRNFLDDTAEKTQSQKKEKVRVREHFAIVYFEATCSDQELQLNLVAIERLRGVAFTRIMKLAPEEAKPEDDKPRIITPDEM